MITGKIISSGEHVVFIDNAVVDPRPSQKLVNHSPDGFAWGYAGSGPAQLALALLYWFKADADWCLANYQQFKFDVIAKLPQGAFKLPEKAVKDWIKSHDRH